MQSKQQLGASGELQARKHLESKGLKLIVANARTRFGEIDLIMQDGGTLVFVEVKTRTGADQGVPEEAVTPQKLHHTIRAAEAYLQEHQLDTAWRIDVVAIDSELRHLRNVTLT